MPSLLATAFNFVFDAGKSNAKLAERLYIEAVDNQHRGLTSNIHEAQNAGGKIVSSPDPLHNRRRCTPSAGMAQSSSKKPSSDHWQAMTSPFAATGHITNAQQVAASAHPASTMVWRH